MNHRRFLPPLVIFLATVALSNTLHATPEFHQQVVSENKDFVISKLATGFGQSWGLAILPGNKLLLGEWKTGKVWKLDLKHQNIQQVGTIGNLYTKGQAGLFSIKADNRFIVNHTIYLTRAVSQGSKSTTQLISAELSDNQLINQDVLFTATPYVNDTGHFGGALAQDDNGYLYLSVGDRHHRPMVQMLDNHIGKIMRLNKLGRAVSDYSAPTSGLPEIYSYGHRNPQGLYWSTTHKQLWEAEHGPKGGDEVNVIEAGKNYGWPVITYGEEYRGGKIGEGVTKPGMEQPRYYYVPSIATSDILVYENDYLAIFNKSVLQASLKANLISQLQLNKQQNLIETHRWLAGLGERWRSIKADVNGVIYLLAQSGVIYQIKRPEKNKGQQVPLKK